MRDEVIEADYVIVGAGAVGMAFADSLLTSSDATMAIVDRRYRPGGHWLDAYPFVRLHAPSALYGVNSLPLGTGQVDQVGFNRGYHELATGPEICAYFERVMRQRLLPSGRVTYLPLSELGNDDQVTSRVTGARRRVRARRKIVDTTFADTRVPAIEPPPFRVADGVRCVPPGALVGPETPFQDVVILGAGKTAMDTAIWLLEQGTEPEAITWVRPRDAWLLNRAHVQPTFDRFEQTMGALAAELEIARDATSLVDLFARLEAASHLQRIDLAVQPTMFRCAFVSEAELGMLRRITRVVRLGHVKALEPGRVVLERGEVPVSPGALHVHCTADGIRARTPVPIFQERRIVPQYVRRCSPTLSAALVAHLEATMVDDAEKNALCTPIPIPNEPLDWLRNVVLEARNGRLWAKTPAIDQWLGEARLDAYRAIVTRAMSEPSPARFEILMRYRNALKPGIARLTALIEQAP